MKKVLRVALYLLLAAGFIYFVAVIVPHHFVQKKIDAGERVAKSVSGLLKNLYNLTTEPESKDRTISFLINETNSIYELSSVSRKFTHTYEYSTKWLGSTKTIRLVGEYEAKAGIDLTMPLKIKVSQDGKLVSVQLPDMKLNSLTTLDEQAVLEKSGWWNRISSEDKEAALKALRKDAEISLKESDLLMQAEQRFFEQLKARIEGGILDPGVEVRRVATGAPLMPQDSNASMKRAPMD